MPSAAKDAIIDLTDIVEEGHPETPNLKTAKPSAAKDETLDDLDLEREIDQIFADLGPPEREDQGGASGKRGGPGSETLNLDELFEDKDGKALEVSNGADGTDEDDSALDFANDFEKLFAEEAPSQQKSRQESGGSVEAALQSSDEPDWLAELDGLGLDEAKPETPNAPTDTSTDVSLDISDAATTDSEMKAEAGLEDVPETEPEAGSEPETPLETDLGTTEEDLGGVSSIPEKTANKDPALDEASTPESTVSEATPKVALPESVLQRLQELEDRLVALENQEPPRIDVPEPDIEGLLAQVDERIAASPALTGLGEAQSEALQAMESRLSAIEQQEPPQPDTEGLLAQMDQRILEQVGSRLDSVQQTVDGMAEQMEIAVAKVVDAELLKISESMSADVELRLKERLEESFAKHLEKRLDAYKASIKEDIEQQLASSLEELKQGNGEEPEDPRIAELATGLEALRERIEELAQDRPAESGASELLERAEHLETRILETVRQEMQEMRTDWDGQKSALAKDLENSLNYWAKLQDKFKALQGEWQALRQEQESPRIGEQEASVAAFPDGWRDELAALLDERLESLRTELRRELTDEMDKAVPLAAARIIREEIQAMSQEEEEAEL